MNFSELYESSFFKMGKFFYRTSDNSMSDDSSASIYDTRSSLNIHDVDYYTDSGHFLPSNQFTVNRLTHLSMALSINSNFCPPFWKSIITNQWIEVTNNIELISKNNSTRPGRSLLIILPPGSFIRNHSHFPSMHSVTFTFRYVDSSCKNYHPSNISFGLGPVNFKKYYDPIVPKYVFSIKDSSNHGVWTSDWSFFYVYDFFDGYLNLDCLKGSDFHTFDLT